MTNKTKQVLILYYSSSGSIESMAKVIARGVESVKQVEAKLRTVPPISTVCQATELPVPQQGAAYVELADLETCDGLILGSPSYFGNMASPLKYFWDSTTSLWLNNALNGKPAGVFTSSASLHGGQETVLLTMMMPLLHHGMLLVGLPYSNEQLHTTHSGGTPYGSSHHANDDLQYRLTQEEIKLCYTHGKRLAEVVLKLAD